MRTGTKLALALSATLALAACKEENDNAANTNTAEQNETAETELPEGHTFVVDYENLSLDNSLRLFLTDVGNVVLTRNGETFTADIRGHCAEYVLEEQTCAEYLTERVQNEALTHNFFTATTNKLSTDPAFIDAGLTGHAAPHQREEREEDIARRLALTSDEAILQRLEDRASHSFYIIDSVSDLDLADAPLVDMAPE